MQRCERSKLSVWIASLRGHAEVVRLLLSHKNVDPNAKDDQGVTCLWAAAQNNNTDVCEVLYTKAK